MQDRPHCASVKVLGLGAPQQWRAGRMPGISQVPEPGSGFGHLGDGGMEYDLDPLPS